MAEPRPARGRVAGCAHARHDCSARYAIMGGMDDSTHSLADDIKQTFSLCPNLIPDRAVRSHFVISHALQSSTH